MVIVLVSSRDSKWCGFLQEHLPPREFQVLGPVQLVEFFEVAKKSRPQIAVLECLPAHGESVQMQVALLKDLRPEIRIIVISRQSSEEDGRIVEQGLFYYTSDPDGFELVQLVEAAALSLSVRSSQREAHSRLEGAQKNE